LNLEGLRIVHGSTVATNAVLQGRGVRTVYIGNRGFADLLSIGRQARPCLYDLQPALKRTPVPASHCLETGGRLSADGDVLEALSDEDIQVLCQQVQALKPRSIAINLLFSYLDPSLEQRIAAAMPDKLYVSCSSEVLPEYKEYERGMATWLNAYVGPLMQGYLHSLERQVAPASVAVMQSSAGTVNAKQAGRMAVNLLLSGPAGGLMAAQYIGRQIACEQLLTLDMGGTSTDVAMINGDIRLTSEGRIGDYPVAVPMVDMHTIGAGGGSIARVDAGGMLHVGPESAGASPGPACYGQGGTQVTVTDANLLLGRIPADARLGGHLGLNIEAARKVMAALAADMRCSIEQAAHGVIRVANEHMVRALRVITLHKGCDPRDYLLVSFGGAGGLHVCALAEALQIRRVMVPVYAGVLSALGMLLTPVSRHKSLSLLQDLAIVDERKLGVDYKNLLNKGVEELYQEGLALADMVIKFSMDLRYQGQSYYLNIAFDPDNDSLEDCQQRFSELHRLTYGHLLQGPVELVNIRVVVSGPTPEVVLAASRSRSRRLPVQQTRLHGFKETVPVYQRVDLEAHQVFTGPALVAESVATTYITAGWRGYCDEMGNLILEKD
jgi:N-methylhydantoinase A